MTQKPAMRTEAEVRAELSRLCNRRTNRMPQYARTALELRIIQLEWVLGADGFDDK